MRNYRSSIKHGRYLLPPIDDLLLGAKGVRACPDKMPSQLAVAVRPRTSPWFLRVPDDTKQGGRSPLPGSRVRRQCSARARAPSRASSPILFGCSRETFVRPPLPRLRNALLLRWLEWNTLERTPAKTVPRE